MKLKIQIISIIFSIAYGIVFGIFYNLSYNLLYKTTFRYKLLNNLLFTINIFLIYFIIMLKISYGDIRILFLILLFISFVLTINKTKFLRKFVKCLKINKKKVH